MAANSKSAQGIASLGKRVVKQIWTVNSSSRFSSSLSATAARREVSTSAYDKNLDDQLRPGVVPDDLIQLQSDKYWEPHPKTGVFGPATERNSGAGGETDFSTSSANGGHNTELEEKAWFRPTSLEDLEKPHHT